MSSSCNYKGRALVLLLLAACASPSSRIKKHAALFDAYPPNIQARIKAGAVDVGFDQDMVRMALGEPARVSSRKTADSSQEVWSYGATGVRPGFGFGFGSGFGGGFGGVSVGGEAPERERDKVVFEHGRVVAVEKLEK